MAQSVLREIAQHLSVLAAEGETEAMDLHSLPMTAADRGELEDSLGRGEVEAILNVAGTSVVWELAIPASGGSAISAPTIRSPPNGSK